MNEARSCFNRNINSSFRVLLRRHKKRIHKLEWEKEVALIGPENMDGRSARFLNPPIMPQQPPPPAAAAVVQPAAVRAD